MAVSLVNGDFANATTSGTSHSLSFGFTPTSGNLIVVFASFSSGDTIVSSVDAGWTEISNNTGSTRQFTNYWWYKVSDGTETSISFSTNFSYVCYWGAQEFSGLATTSPLDKAAENEGSNNTSVTSVSTGTTDTLTVSDGYAVALLGVDLASGWDTGRSISDSFTEIAYSYSFLSQPGIALAYKQLSANTAVSATWETTDAGEQAYAAIAVFKQAAAGGVSGTLSATETGSDTASLSGNVLVSGALSATESGIDTAALSGDVLVQGALSVTESGADTAALTGQVILQGYLDATETGSDVAAFSGFLPGAYPSLSAATVTSITATSATPRVTISWP